MSGKKRPPTASKPPAQDAAPTPAPTPAPATERPASPSPVTAEQPIVGIGASAGGLAAFTELLRALPADTGMTYVLVQHLDPSHESALAEILSRVAHMPVHPAADGQRVDPNCVYVIPPDTRIALTDGHLRVTPRESVRGVPTPINYFFQSLAATYGPRAVAIVLSGTGADGASGMEAIKAEGGITMAQDDASAQYATMPQSAVATGAVDFVLTPRQMAAELVRIGRHLAAHPASDDVRRGAGETDLTAILTFLRKRTDVDFRQYKQASVQRRVLRRMLFTQRDTYATYLAELKAKPAEVEALYHSLLIGVSSFFRDPEVFEALTEIGFPTMLKDHGHDGAVRVWVPGCAGGEEAYSIAICLVEFLNDAASDVPIQVFGTDLSEPAIAKARAGLYPKTIATDIAPERLRRFFVEEGGGYRITKVVRDLCVFARQDLTRDPPFSQMDLISCRNLLIYLEPGLQKRLFQAFHYALKPAGVLLLGTAESVGTASELFAPLDKQYALYGKLTAHRPRPPIGLFSSSRAMGPPPSHEVAVPASAPSTAPSAVPSADEVLQREAGRVLLATYLPASVVVDDRLRIVEFHGRTGPYLEHAPGTASLELLRVVRPELVTSLRAALHRAGKTKEPAREEGITVHDGGAARLVDLEVIPFNIGPAAATAFIVLFTDAAQPSADESSTAAQPGRPRGRRPREARRVQALTEELASMRRHLQEVIEDQEGVNEELRAANEEIQSSNEELQSTNEELETAKEELQSTNEELTTVNDEMRQRNIELHATNADLSNVLGSTQLPLIIVGSDLCIRRFTPATSAVMKIVPTDVGRPVGDIKLNVQDVDLDQLAVHVMESLGTTERKVQDAGGRWWLLTARPYATPERQISGAIISFYDIDAIERQAQRVAASRAFAEAIVETVREPLLVLDADLRIRSASQEFCRTFRVTPADTTGAVLAELGNGQWAIPALHDRLHEVLHADTTFEGFEVEHDFPAIGHKVMVLNGRRLKQSDEAPVLVLLAIEDITARKQAAERLHFLATASERLAASLDKDSVLAVATEIAVPSVADWCVLYLRGEDGDDPCVAERGVPPGSGTTLAVPAHAAAGHPAGDGATPHGPPKVTSEVTAAVVSRVPPAVLPWIERAMRAGRGALLPNGDGAAPSLATVAAGDTVPSASHSGLAVAGTVGGTPGSGGAMVVPLAVRSEVMGALVLGTSGSGRHFGADDLALAEDFARRVAVALDSARLYSTERAARHEADTARADAEAANRAKAEFLAAMSHELRTPLNAIQGYVQLLEMEVRGPITEPQREDLHRIERSHHHLTRLIDHVLDFAKLEAGHVAIAITDIHVAEVLTAILELTEVQMRAKGLRFACRRCDAAVTVRADRERLQQIVLNLLSNAMKFTAPGGAVVLSCVVEQQDVILRVRDTGDGIAAVQLESIFTPFVQLQTGLTRKAQGTGLGLTISREFARGMAGDLTVESVPGEGSTFTLRLPRGVVAQTAQPEGDAEGEDDAGDAGDAGDVVATQGAEDDEVA